MWFAWGYDIYTFEWGTPLVVLPDIYYPLTKKYVNKGFIGKFKKNIGKFFNKNEILEKAVSRVDYFSGVLPFEYELIMKNEFFHAKPIEFSYGKVDSYICEKDLYSPIVSGANILIGNSADPSNNHLDILDILTGLNLVGKKIVLPLSYGGSSGYKGHIMYVGKSLWGEGFIGLTTFIPFEEYRSIVNECQNVIFFHERQQAMGNIFLSLWNGSKVFLSDSSWVYRYLMKLGFVVYSVQKDLKEVELNQKISKDEVLNNRKLLLKYYSLDANLKKLELIYNKISI